jgi:hypothetical protein
LLPVPFADPVLKLSRLGRARRHGLRSLPPVFELDSLDTCSQGRDLGNIFGAKEMVNFMTNKFKNFTAKKGLL